MSSFNEQEVHAEEDINQHHSSFNLSTAIHFYRQKRRFRQVGMNFGDVSYRSSLGSANLPSEINNKKDLNRQNCLHSEINSGNPETSQNQEYIEETRRPRFLSEAPYLMFPRRLSSQIISFSAHHFLEMQVNMLFQTFREIDNRSRNRILTTDLINLILLSSGIIMEESLFETILRISSRQRRASTSPASKEAIDSLQTGIIKVSDDFQKIIYLSPLKDEKRFDATNEEEFVLDEKQSIKELNQVFCVVCQEEFCSEEKYMSMPYGHLFHHCCLYSWLKLHNSCPICRFILKSNDITITSTQLLLEDDVNQSNHAYSDWSMNSTQNEEHEKGGECLEVLLDESEENQSDLLFNNEEMAELQNDEMELRNEIKKELHKEEDLLK